MKKLISIIMACALCSCQTATQVSTLATPGNVQTVITGLGSAVMSKLTPLDKSVVHQFAHGLLALTAATLDSATVSALIPSSVGSSPYVGPLVQAGVLDINLALAKFGSHNVTVLAYADAVGNGLLQAGF